MKREKMKRGKRIVLIIVIVLVALFVGLLLFLTISEYRPEAIEPAQTQGEGKEALSSELTVMSWNIGYGGLGKDQDFFMDGGKMVQPDNKEYVEGYLAGIEETLRANPADAYFLQEVDRDSKRSYHIDEVQQISEATGLPYAFAYNFNCNFVPYPLPMIGQVKGGLCTLTDLEVTEAQRISLPVPFKWPISTCNLKRCLLTERIPAPNGKELVLVNLHLEAYDDGEGKAAQTKVLMDFVTSEYEKGNYVIAGGDFNQTFPGADFPVLDTEAWAPGVLEEDMLPEGWQFAVDVSSPSCRLLNKPFSGDYEATQLYVIDGFILSPNVGLKEVKTMDIGFEYADHNPVRLDVSLQ